MAKSGDLRVLKSGAIYGPFDRAVLEQMIESGRIDPRDQISVRGAPWIPIADFLAATPATSAVPSPAAPPSGSPTSDATTPGSAPRKQGSLRVLRGNRMVGSLDRGQVEQLHAVGRLGDDDLICAKGGPWMLVGDFLAPPPPRSATGVTPATPATGQIESSVVQPRFAQPQPMRESRTHPPVTQSPVRQSPVTQSPVRQPPIVQPVHGRPPVARPVYDQPPVARPVYDQPPVAEPLFAQPVDGELPVVEPTYEEPEWVTPEDAAVETAIRRDLFAELDEPVLKDEWYVRVRGIHSAPLKKQHVRMLLESREITLDAAARHCSWHETDWRAIRSIPQLAGIAE